MKATDAPITIHFQSKALSADDVTPPGPGFPLSVLGVVVVVMVPSPVVMMVAFTVLMAVLVRVLPMAAARVRDARILVEDERLDRHRDGEGGHPHAAEIDVVEIPKGDTVDHQHLGGDAQLILEERAQRVGDIAVEDDEQGLPPRKSARQRLQYPTGQTGEPGVGRGAAPAERERHFRIAFDDIEIAKVIADRGCDR